MFQSTFFLHALIATLLTTLMAGYFSAFVVQQKQSFMGDGLAHATLGGVALAILLKAEPLWVVLPFTVIVALGICWVRQNSKLGSDTAIGIFFSAAMAFGLALLSMRKSFSVDPMSYIFGSLLAIRPFDLWMSAGALVLVALSVCKWGSWSFRAFDSELAQSAGVSPREEYWQTALLAIVIVVSVKLVGVLLMATLLIIPGAIARLFARTFSGMTLGSILISVTTGFAGLVLSYQRDLPSGATIVLLQSAIFFVCFLWSRRRALG